MCLGKCDDGMSASTRSMIGLVHVDAGEKALSDHPTVLFFTTVSAGYGSTSDTYIAVHLRHPLIHVLYILNTEST